MNRSQDTLQSSITNFRALCNTPTFKWPLLFQWNVKSIQKNIFTCHFFTANILHRKPWVSKRTYEYDADLHSSPENRNHWLLEKSDHPHNCCLLEVSNHTCAKRAGVGLAYFSVCSASNCFSSFEILECITFLRHKYILTCDHHLPRSCVLWTPYCHCTIKGCNLSSTTGHKRFYSTPPTPRTKNPLCAHPRKSSLIPKSLNRIGQRIAC